MPSVFVCLFVCLFVVVVVVGEAEGGAIFKDRILGGSILRLPPVFHLSRATSQCD